MSFARKRLLLDMVKDAGLEVIGTDIKSGRVCIEAKAPNGVVRSFSISTSSRPDTRGDLNEHARIKRFAKENSPAAPAQHEETPDMAKKEAPATPAAEQLTPIEFYRVCEWVKEQDMNKYSASDMFVLAAGAGIERTVSLETVREAMAATGTLEPDHWTALPDPYDIIARELEQLMTSLGHDASPLFKRYLATIA